MTKSARILIVAAFCSAVALAVAGAGAEAEVTAPVDPCITGGFTTVELAQAATVDEILVRMRGDSPADGGADVRVEAGAGERILRVAGADSHGLSFAPALSGNSFAVSVEPALDAPVSACVGEVILRHGGAVVATVRP